MVLFVNLVCMYYLFMFINSSLCSSIYYDFITNEVYYSNKNTMIILIDNNVI